MNTQQKIAALIAKRGYRDGWTPEQFIARQVVKLQEELGELTGGVDVPQWSLYAMQLAAQRARGAFDNEALWNYDIDVNVNVMRSELADLVVVACVLAEALAEMSGQPFDVMAAALEKAQADVERGVREENEN